MFFKILPTLVNVSPIRPDTVFPRLFSLRKKVVSFGDDIYLVLFLVKRIGTCTELEKHNEKYLVFVAVGKELSSSKKKTVFPKNILPVMSNHLRSIFRLNSCIIFIVLSVTCHDGNAVG